MMEFTQQDVLKADNMAEEPTLMLLFGVELENE